MQNNPPQQPPGNPYGHYQNPNHPYGQQPALGGRQEIANATMTLVLGICSIVLCGLGPILATIGLVTSSKSLRDYNANPGQYDPASYSQLNAGRVCCIIGLCVGCICWVIMTIYFIMAMMMVEAATEIIKALPPPH